MSLGKSPFSKLNNAGGKDIITDREYNSIRKGDYELN